MDRPLQEIIHQQCKGELKLDLMKHKLEIMYHNVQSLINKHVELTVPLNTSLQSVDVLCFTEHWLSEDQINMLEIHNFKFISKFCRKEFKNGGSCIFGRKELSAKEVTSFQDLCCEKNFEMSVVEFVDLKWLLICIYRSPQ
jgi:hypothetical protein